MCPCPPTHATSVQQLTKLSRNRYIPLISLKSSSTTLSMLVALSKVSDAFILRLSTLESVKFIWKRKRNHQKMYYFKRTCDLGPIQKALGNKSETIYVCTPKQSSPQKGRAIFRTVSQYPTKRKKKYFTNIPPHTHAHTLKETRKASYQQLQLMSGGKKKKKKTSAKETLSCI